MKKFAIALFVASTAACGGSGTSSTVSPGPTPTAGTQVSDIQGSADASPLDGQVVTVTAIVTGDFQDNDGDASRNLGGFYIQQEIPDADPLSSEGVFVFDGSNPTTDVTAGDRVEVQGSVTEYFGETQINATSVSVTGSGMIQATDLNLPASGLANNSDGDHIPDLERYEGMLVRFPQTLTVSSLRFLEQYGEVGLAVGGRLFQFTSSNSPDVAAYAAYAESLAARKITLDDGLRDSNPSFNRLLNAGVSPDYSIRAGDSISGITGNLRYSRGSGGGGIEGWRIMPTEAVQFADDNPRPGAPSVAGGTRVASVNLYNFFSNIDSGANICGPDGDDSCRGADNGLELSRQLDKIVSALVMMDADIIGLVELENNDSDSIVAIVDGVNTRLGNGNFDYVDTGSIHDDAIKTGFIYNASTISTRGAYAVLDGSVDARFNDSRNRPALAQSFEVTANGAVLTVVVNHLKSKGSSCDADGDPNTGDGQGNCNQVRSNAAAALADWISTDPTASDDSDFLIIGDLNAYTMEDPLTALKNTGLSSLLEGHSNAYSFLFDEQVGALDHALASASLAGQVAEVIEWHINADEPPMLDYNLEFGRDASLFDGASPYRASDHDPIIVGLDLTN